MYLSRQGLHLEVKAGTLFVHLWHRSGDFLKAIFDIFSTSFSYFVGILELYEQILKRTTQGTFLQKLDL
jgi:hypothetical protein